MMKYKCVTHPKRSVFVLIQRRDTGNLLYVTNRHGSVGLPGGKAEVRDKDPFATAKREFSEETGEELPESSDWQYFEWGGTRSTIRVYYTHIDACQAVLFGGPVQDPTGAIVTCQWASYNDINSPALLHHIRHALFVWKAVDRKRIHGHRRRPMRYR